MNLTQRRGDSTLCDYVVNLTLGEVKPCPGGGEIQYNLPLQVVDGVEALFISEFVHEGQLKVFAIEIAAEIQ